jgi:hypothetical protein
MQATACMASVVSSTRPARPRLIQSVLPRMRITMPRSKTTTFWAGLALLVLGAALATLCFWSVASERAANRDLDSMVNNLRANGAIVENYYKVIGGDGLRTQHTHLLRTCVVAGIFVVGGATMIIVSRKVVPAQIRGTDTI